MDTLDPQAKAVLDEMKPLAPAVSDTTDDAQWLADFRCQVALLRNFAGELAPVQTISHLIVRGPVGPVPVRLYRPRAGRLPVLFHVHGGGGIAGSVDGHDALLRTLAMRTGWLVAAPDYRLAPEYRHPVQLEECFAALLAVAALPDIDPEQVVVSGDSIGGAIAATLAMLVRDRGGAALAGQMLLYPNTDLRADAHYASRDSQEGRMIRKADLERQVKLYVAAPEDRTSPLASPIAGNLGGVPPAFMVTLGCDPLRDEGDAYATALADAGVEVCHRRVPGMIHAFLQMRGRIRAADAMIEDIGKWLDERQKHER